jgi:PAS domain S-box-containing protein
LSLVIAWWLFVETPSVAVAPGDWVGGTLFLTVALAIAGITSALRVARSGNVALRAELAQREAQCTELAGRLAELADQLPAMLWWCGPGGRCEYVNRAWRDWTGQPLDAALEDGWQQGIHADDQARWRKALARALRDRSAFSVEYRRRRHDGDYVAVVDTGVVRRLEDGGCAGLIGHCHELPDARRHAASPAGEAHVAGTHPD